DMTSLQGVMGRDYALQSGEPDEVAQAIFEHYLPRSAGDTLPKSKAGLAVGLADRLDSLAGLFAAGLAPTGNKDPFAQRRAALGLVGNLMAWNLSLDLGEVLKLAADNLPIPVSDESQEQSLTFVIERLRNVLLDTGTRYDVVDAVIAEQGHNPARANQAAKELSQWVAQEEWEVMLQAYARCVRITRDQVSGLQYRAMSEINPAEGALFTAVEKVEAMERTPGSVDDFFHAFVTMIPEITQFFDDVLVMDENENVKNNRLALLQRIALLADGVADLSALEGF
ncbi:MAG: glycine--tRNA ligase subunit beta, partial [Chloroflexi bacterium]|nr:glycine--tRNA ligase subunit beta [Chloroflexota bacterium]